jgi:uncharacterized protein
VHYADLVCLNRFVTDPEEKATALKATVEHIIPGRSTDAREGSEREIAKTAVVALDLKEVSAKTNSDPVVDDEADMELPVWAGVVPCALAFGVPEPDAQTAARHIGPPAYVENYRRPAPGKECLTN